MNRRTLFFNVIFVLFGAAFSQDDHAGPYLGKIESIEKCDDEGTKDFSFTVEFDKEKDSYSGVFYKKKDLGDNVLVTVEVEHQAGEAWIKEFSQNVGGVCQLIKAAPEAMKNFLDSIQTHECPILEGTNIVKDLKNSFIFPFIKTMKYGKRRVDIIFTDKENARLGCFRVNGNIIPKPEAAQ